MLILGHSTDLKFTLHCLKTDLVYCELFLATEYDFQGKSGIPLIRGVGGNFGRFSKFQEDEECSGSRGMRIYGSWQIFRIQGDGICQTMTFSRGVQTPDDTMNI